MMYREWEQPSDKKDVAMRLFMVTGTWSVSGGRERHESMIVEAGNPDEAVGAYVRTRHPQMRGCPSLVGFICEDISQDAWNFARRYPEHPVTDGAD